MPNALQKLLYNVSAVAPLLIMLSITWWIQNRSAKNVWYVIIALVMIAIALSIAFMISFRHSKNALPPIRVRVEEFSPHDGWIVAYFISYIVPFASIVIDDFNLLLSGAIAIAIIAIAPFVNTAMPNPLLFMCGYHFYLIKTEHGAADMLLISKRRWRNKKEIKYVKRVFEFLLLDDGELRNV